MLTRAALSANPRTARVVPLTALAVLLTALFGAAPALAEAPVAGQSINMVSGKTLPGGDPYLQRQNEPSLAVSSRNPRHLLAGANDYRTVDFPGLPDGTETGDSWLGLFKSFDGGETWQSTLIPGFPQDAGYVGPLKGYTAAADPIVRAGTHGLFYYGGIVFNRSTNLGLLKVSTFLDYNNKENGEVAAARDPIRFEGTVVVDTGTSGQFLDKPWLGVDVPRAGALSRTFTVDGTSQTVPCGHVYLAWAKFTGSRSTKIMVSRSRDCGFTWENPTKLSESNAINQGTVVSVGPDGAVYVAWRRFAAGSDGDAILFSKSTDFGKTFTRASTIAPAAGSTFLPFDQASNPAQSPYQTAFRTNTYPTMVAAGNGRVQVAWAQRPAANGFARIVMVTSTDGGDAWTAPAAVDDGPLTDDVAGSFDRGHQFMPALTFSAGRLMLLYYDTRLDHTAGKFEPTLDYPDAQGRFYLESRELVGEADLDADAVFTPTVDDANLAQRRHTIDVRVAQLDLCAAGPGLTTAKVSRPPFGIADFRSGQLQQLKFNPPNLPLFGRGKIPFVGDYIDIAGSDFTANGDGTWSFNAACSTPPVFQATWTSNEDVRPPSDGDWTSYTPVGRPGCDPERVGMRNQNIYSSRLSEGLLVSSPQNAKPLKPFDGTAASVRAFVVLAQNLTDTQRTFRLHIANQPVGGKASFIKWNLDGPVDDDLDIAIGPRSGISRPVFATSTDPKASLRVEVTETSGGGHAGFVVLNADPTTVPLDDPDGGPAGVNTVEIYTPSVSNPSVYNPSVLNPSVSNPSVSNPSVLNPSVYNPSVSNPSVLNPSVSNPSVYNSTEANPSVLNPSVLNSALVNAPISDASYAVTNAGNTSASYRVQLVGDVSAVPGPLQLLVSKNQLSPTSDGCQIVESAQSTVLANIANPPIAAPSTSLGPELEDSAVTNTTFSLRPGETGYVTLRGPYDLAAMRGIASAVTPVLIPHPTDPASPEYAAPLAITNSGSALPDATFGVPYSASLTAFGGQTPYSFSSTGLPTDLTINLTTGLISGTPRQAGTFTATMVVTDSGTSPTTGQPSPTTVARTFSISVAPAATTTALTSSANPSTFGQSVTFTATVTGPGGTPTGTVAFKDGATTLGAATLSSGNAAITTSTLSVGGHSITAQYAGDTHFVGSASALLTQTVQANYAFAGFLTPLRAAGSLSNPTYSGAQTFGSAVPVKWQIKDASGSFVGDLATATWLRAYVNSSAQCKGAPATGASYTVLYSPTTGAKGNSTFRYGSNQYTFNWDTGSTVAKGCYTLALQLSDGGGVRATNVLLK